MSKWESSNFQITTKADSKNIRENRKIFVHGRSTRKVFGWSRGGGGKAESSVKPGVAVEWQGGQN